MPSVSFLIEGLFGDAIWLAVTALLVFDPKNAKIDACRGIACIAQPLALIIGDA
jgi:hypothetical protein